MDCTCTCKEHTSPQNTAAAEQQTAPKPTLVCDSKGPQPYGVPAKAMHLCPAAAQHPRPLQGWQLQPCLHGYQRPTTDNSTYLMPAASVASKLAHILPRHLIAACDSALSYTIYNKNSTSQDAASTRMPQHLGAQLRSGAAEHTMMLLVL